MKIVEVVNAFNEYTLSFDTEHHEYCMMYRGNQNVIIECTSKEADTVTKILIPRFMLEKFIETINGS